ncbi:MAG: hypothetical protein K9J06_13505 [Flavobacteriales bacterium]|nr:hypothetical protein [Flavobacteriales bacterium]
MSIKIKLKNRIDQYVTIDEKVRKDIQSNDYLMSLKFLDNLRAHSSGYAVYQRCVTTKQGPTYETIYLHKYIAEKFCKKPVVQGKKQIVRFINGNVLDSRIENLEWTTMGELRRQMKSSRSQTGYRGVTQDSKGRFRAIIYHQKEPINLGLFTTAEKAADAYNKKSIELFGVTSGLNKVDKKK